jgi:flagellar biogenesis protein FliO
MDFLSLALSAGLALVSFIVWLVRLEGRLNVQAAKQDSTEKRIDGLEERIFAQLDRIESKIDAKADK